MGNLRAPWYWTILNEATATSGKNDFCSACLQPERSADRRGLEIPHDVLRRANREAHRDRLAHLGAGMPTACPALAFAIVAYSVRASRATPWLPAVNPTADLRTP